MTEHTPTPWFHRQAGDVSRNGDHYDWIADHPDPGQHKKIIVSRDSCTPEDFAFIVKAVNSHDALVNLLMKVEPFLSYGDGPEGRLKERIKDALASIKERP